MKPATVRQHAAAVALATLLICTAIAAVGLAVAGRLPH